MFRFAYRQYVLAAAMVVFSTTAAHSQEPLKIRIGIEPSYPPFVITNPDGSMSGLAGC